MAWTIKGNSKHTKGLATVYNTGPNGEQCGTTHIWIVHTITEKVGGYCMALPHAPAWYTITGTPATQVLKTWDPMKANDPNVAFLLEKREYMEDVFGVLETNEFVFLTGTITKLHEAGYCMDGASHEINTVQHGAHHKERLVTKDGALNEKLDQASGTWVRITVGGYCVQGPEPGCHSVNVIYAASTNKLGEKLGLQLLSGSGDRPFPW